ncbi:MAG TPA: xylose isomerase [Planctomycetes bacterium]|nr:xylose isomerase [Planctomycetota bacterium]
MNRRTLLKTGLAAGTASLLPAASINAKASNADSRSPKEDFQLAYAPHFGMFQKNGGSDPVDQLKWARDQGFTAWEDNQMTRRSVADQERIGAALQDLGMQMGVFVANFGTAFGKKSFTTGDSKHMEAFLSDLNKSVEVAKRVGAKWMTIVLGDQNPRARQGTQDADAIEMLKRGAEIFEPHNLVMVMEPLNFRDHSGMYLERSDHAYMLCKAVGSPAVKILFDIYHQQIAEGNLIPNINQFWDEIGYFQVGDNPGRNEPGTGEINYRNVFKNIHSKGFSGVLGMEHGNSQGGKEGEMAVVQAYRDADAF